MDYTVIIAIGIAAFLLPIIGAICKIVKDAKGDKQPNKRQVDKATPVKQESVKTKEEINKWLKKNGFTTRCVFDKDADLSYSPDEDLIYVPESYNGEPDSLFIRCLRKFGLTSDFDTITLSFLHELGHAQTLHLLTTKESKKCDVLKAMYAVAIDEEDDDFYLKYWEVTCSTKTLTLVIALTKT